MMIWKKKSKILVINKSLVIYKTMVCYCFCVEKNQRIMVSSICVACGSKKFIKQQEAKGLLGKSLGPLLI